MLENKERARNVSEQTDIIVNMGKFIEKIVNECVIHMRLTQLKSTLTFPRK